MNTRLMFPEIYHKTPRRRDNIVTRVSSKKMYYSRLLILTIAIIDNMQRRDVVKSKSIIEKIIIRVGAFNHNRYHLGLRAT